jgi:hypothetical protein
MTRGNQRDKAREKNLKELAGAVRASQRFTPLYHAFGDRPGRVQDTVIRFLSAAYPVDAHVVNAI